MGLWLACKAFWKALRDPAAGRLFVGTAKPPHQEEDKDDEDPSHLRLLSALQRTGRLVDFLQEEIDGFDDAQIGAAVREVHRSSRQCLDELVALKPLLDDSEGVEISLPKGYDASRIKVVGKVVGEPPFRAVVVHRGWQARKKNLPKATTAIGTVIAPAEVEVR